MPFDFSPLWISLETALTATVLTVALGLAAAGWRAGRRNRLWEVFDGVLLLPLVLPPTVVGFFLLVLFGRTGPLGSLLWRAGMTVVFSWPATVIAATVVAFPLMYLTARGSFELDRPEHARGCPDAGVVGVGSVPVCHAAPGLAGDFGGGGAFVRTRAG